MSWIAAGIAGAAAITGGVVGAKGAAASGKAAYKAGQIEYHQELEKSHYEVKILQRQMLEAMHYQMAQAGGSGTAADVGSPVLGMMNTLNDLQEDKAQIYRTGAKNAHKLWVAGADKQLASQYKATGSLLSGIGGAAQAYATGAG